MSGYPAPGRVREWCKVSQSALSNEDLEVICLAEIDNQSQMCRVPVDGPTPGQVAAYFRRCARAIAARGVPLGLTSGGEQYGPSRLPMFDAEIERYEGPTRMVVFG
jgi:hypothetical protein